MRSSAPASSQNAEENNTESTSKVASVVRSEAVGWKLGAALLFLGLILACASIEIGFRLFTKSAAPQAKNDRPKRFFFPEDALTDRDFNYPVIKAPNTYRIAVVGDSFTYGVGMQFYDTFPKRLENLLRLSKAKNKIEVLNFGVPGNSTKQELILIQKIAEYKPDLVLLEVTLNDPEIQPYRVTHPSLDELGRPRLSGFIFKYWKSLGFAITRIMNSITHREYEKYYQDLFSSPTTWQPFEQSFDDLKKLAAKNNFAVAIVLFPLFSHSLDAQYPFSNIHYKLGAMWSEKKIPYLDLFKFYRGLANDRLQIVPGVDSHPNEIAHRIAAESIYGWLKRSSILPGEFQRAASSTRRIGDPQSLNRAVERK